MSDAKLNSEFIATVAGVVTVFNYDGETHEYLSCSNEFLPVGVGIPANSCIDAPDIRKEGFAICRTVDFTAWEYVADHRGEVVYRTATGEEVEITATGDYPQGTTTVAPPGPYVTWNGNEWITDTEAKHTADVEAAEQQRASLLAEAQETIGFWQTELQLGIISDEDKASLVAWMKYIKSVQVTDTSKAPAIIWPIKPA